MKTEAYVERGRWVTDHIGPINAIMTIMTAVLIPVLDFVRPHFPYIGYVAALAVMVFLVLLAMKIFGVPKNGQLHSSLVLCSGVCAAAFSVGAIASARHADEGGHGCGQFPVGGSDAEDVIHDEHHAGRHQERQKRRPSCGA